MQIRRRLAAILAADVVGYSRLMGEDEEGTLGRIKALLHDVVRPAVAEHNGRIVKTMGDGFLCEFGSVIQAFHCACKLQQAAQSRSVGEAPGDRIALRIGINVGDIIRERGDVFGEGVNIAARLEGMARPGAICVSGRAWEDLRQLKLTFQDLGELRLKNITQPIRAFSFTPGGASAERTEPALAVAKPVESSDNTSQPRAPGRYSKLGLGLAAVTGVAGAALALAGSALFAPRAPPPASAQFVAAQIEGMPCSWLRVSEHSNVDGVQIYRLAGSSNAPPDMISQTLMRTAEAKGLDVDRVIARDVAPLYDGQCAWIDGLKAFRYTGVPRFTLELVPLRPGVTRVAVTFQASELGGAGAIYGVEPSGRVERIIDRTQLAQNPAVVDRGGGAYTLNLEVDHEGWNGLVFVRSETAVPEGVVERPIANEADRGRFDSLARSGGWQFELAWFRAGN